MIEFDVDMGYLLEEEELDRVVLNDENGEHEPMTFYLSGGELHEGMDKSRWHKLFGTPERAARTLLESTSECRCCVIRSECGYDLDWCVMYDYGKLLEWLEGDA